MASSEVIKRHRNTYWTIYMDDNGVEFNIKDMNAGESYTSLLNLNRSSQDGSRIFKSMLREYHSR